MYDRVTILKGKPEMAEKGYALLDENRAKLEAMPGIEHIRLFEADDDTKIKVNKPLTLVAGQKGIGLQQFLFTADMALSYSIKHSAITLIHKTAKQFADAYTNQTSSIVQAPAGMADVVRK